MDIGSPVLTFGFAFTASLFNIPGLDRRCLASCDLGLWTISTHIFNVDIVTVDANKLEIGKATE